LRGHKFKKRKFISVEKNETIESLAPAFRDALRDSNPKKSAEAAISILGAMVDAGYNSDDIVKTKAHLSNALAHYNAGVGAALPAIFVKIGTPPFANPREKAYNSDDSTFVDVVYRAKYVPAGNSLGAFVFGLSKSALAKKYAETDSFAGLPGNESTVPSYKGEGKKWVSERSRKNAQKRALVEQERAALAEKRAKEKQAKAEKGPRGRRPTFKITKE
jgi:hypothetical protein